MSDFLKFLADKVLDSPMHVEIYYSKIVDWCINIYKKGCGENGEDLKIVNVRNHDIELCFAIAQVQLKNWLIEHEDGY